jgi:hypothetical protein
MEEPKMVTPLLIPGLISLIAVTASGAYSKKDNCWFELLPIGSKIRIKKELVLAPGSRELDLSSDEGGGQSISLASSRSSSSPRVLKKGSLLNVESLDLGKDRSSCVTLSVSGSPHVNTLYFCSSHSKLDELRIGDFKKAADKKLSLRLSSDPGDGCWLPAADDGSIRLPDMF